MENSGNADGLASVIAGSTAICTVGKAGKGLSYRGYTIEDLASHACFEEVAFLLLYGKLPNQNELMQYRIRLQQRRNLPQALKDVLERMPKSSHPMDVMRTACSMLGCLEPETHFEQQHDIADRLLALFPAILAYWYSYHWKGQRIETESSEESIAGYILSLLTGKQDDDLHHLQKQALDVSMTLYAEHEFNASTFAARVAASTMSDFYSTITAAIGTLRGPLHGGANEAAMQLIKRFDSPDQAEQGIRQSLAQKELIMGFGHRVYKDNDPRSPIVKNWSKQLAEQSKDAKYFPISERIEATMWEEKKLFPNLDFYSASAYYFMSIPVILYTPLFICSRITGWAAHVFEQRSNNRLIRPMANYNGPDIQEFVNIDERA